MKALKQCVNGCHAPVHPPSKVLCAKCFQGIGDKMEEIIKALEPKKDTEATDA